MKAMKLGNEIFDWNGKEEIFATSYFKVTLMEPVKLIEVVTNTSKQGLVILGLVEVIVDSILFKKSYGAIGDTIEFSGRNLVLLGISIADIEGSINKSNLNDQEVSFYMDEAYSMVSKLKHCIENSTISMNFHSDSENGDKYIIFGRRNFLLIGSEYKFILIHKRQISIREGENKLVLINKEDGILIANKNRVFSIGCPSRNGLGSLLGELGVNITSSILDAILWD